MNVPIADGRPVNVQTMFSVEIPPGVAPGQQFQVFLDGQVMVVTCPPGAGPGSSIQVAVAPPAAGVPVMNAGPMNAGPNVMLMAPPPGYVEVDEISPSGWFCLVAGCFFCPGFNLLGLCMRERRLVPISEVGYY
uniref:Uncharacterized protein n=1 Tax=Prymnesium polylepis TaxID=72548 RepID=A0A7S4MUW9_9EUKA